MNLKDTKLAFRTYVACEEVFLSNLRGVASSHLRVLRHIREKHPTSAALQADDLALRSKSYVTGAKFAPEMNSGITCIFMMKSITIFTLLTGTETSEDIRKLLTKELIK